MEKQLTQLELLRQAQERVSRISLNVQTQVTQARYVAGRKNNLLASSRPHQAHKARQTDAVWADSYPY